MLDKEKILDIFKKISLNEKEQDILMATLMAKNVTQISRITGIPRTSLLYMLKNLQKKRLIKPTVTELHPKRTHWMIDRKTIHSLFRTCSKK